MKSAFRLIVLMLLIAGWGLAALSLHVVRAKGDRIVLIPKQKLGVTDTYVDARAWTVEDVADHTSLVRRILESGKAELFSYVVGDGERAVEEVADTLGEALKHAAEHAPATGKSTGKPAKSATASSANWWEILK